MTTQSTPQSRHTELAYKSIAAATAAQYHREVCEVDAQIQVQEQTKERQEVKKNRRDAIRALLRATPDGLTTAAISLGVGCRRDTATGALAAMPDAYIDRWTAAVTGHGNWAAVWCVVEVPDDCPKPTAK